MLQTLLLAVITQLPMAGVTALDMSKIVLEEASPRIIIKESPPIVIIRTSFVGTDKFGVTHIKDNAAILAATLASENLKPWGLKDKYGRIWYDSDRQKLIDYIRSIDSCN